MWHAPRISGTSEGSISIRRDDFGDVTVLTLSGNLSIGEASVLVREKIRELLKEGRLRFILNYSVVRYIDSSGLHALVTS